MKRLTFVLCLIFLLSLPALSQASQPELMLATTTSTDNTGLLDYLMPEFTKDTGIKIKWVAVGTGKALKMGQNCDVDVLLVHAPPTEKKYVADGYGTDRREIMFNDFVIIGPADDPCGIEGMAVADAMKAIEAKQCIFVSRGDNSGTNKKEIKLWKAAGLPVPDKAEWYVQTGQGMLATINVAAERHGYTMTDRGTYIKFEANKNGTPPLLITVEGDKNLLNQYSVIAVNPKRCSNAKYDLAGKFSEWMAGPKAQKLIKDFKLLGKQLFTPNAK